MGIKKWNVTAIDKKLAVSLADECDIDPFVALLLSARGLTDPLEIEEFLSDDVNLPDPYSFIGMKEAVERIERAVEKFEKIAIYGDYDVDGLTSTAALYSCLNSLGADVQYYIPTRDGDGYGMNNNSILKLKQQGISLIITVDNGISAVNEIEYAKELDIDVVVTDHHLPSDTIPDAVAVVDPKRSDCGSSFKDLSGVGVAFMLICALNHCSCEELIDKYGDLVALGTVADVMPIKKDNRIIVKRGLEIINSHERVGIKALIDAIKFSDKKVTAPTVAFMIAPRINAVGRVGTPDRAVSLLLTDDEEYATTIADELCDFNTHRRQLEEDIIKQIDEYIKHNPNKLFEPILVLEGDNWHHGVLGIVAARITEKYGKPAIIFSTDGNVATGSARSYKGVSIYKIISCVKDKLIRFGGHETAAGLTCDAEKIEEITNDLNKAAFDLYKNLPFPNLNIDCKLNPQNISVDTVYAHNQLEPFGMGNERPVYGFFNMKIDKITPVGQGKHLRISLERNDFCMNAMQFSETTDSFGYNVGDEVDVAVNLDINSYQNQHNLSVVIKDIKPTIINQDELLEKIRAYENFRQFGEPLTIQAPTRDEIAQVYIKIRKLKLIRAADDLLAYRFLGVDYLKLRLILDILSELLLIKLTFDGNTIIEYVETSEKVDLGASKIFSLFNSKEV